MRRSPWERLEERVRPKRLTKKQEHYWDVLMFLVRLLILAAPLYIILSVPGILYFAQVSAANVTSYILNGVGIYTEQNGATLTIVDPVRPFRFMIDEDCTGWKAVAFLFALVFAVKGPKIRSRLTGFAVGTAIIMVANVARILGTVWAERAYGAVFAIAIHDYAFRYGLVALVLGIWVSWLYLNKKFK